MPGEDVHGDPLTILLVEDNLPHAELVKRSLETHAIANKIYHVSDGEAALAYLFRQGVYADPATSPRPHSPHGFGLRTRQLLFRRTVGRMPTRR